jgi:acetoin utilization deacetylase AcuC-like enzyme
MRSCLDVGLGDGVEDDEYLDLLARHIAEILRNFTPDIVFYLAGVDPACGDRYGRLALSDEGIRQRDRHVLEVCLGRRLPAVITLAGGYAATPERTAELHSIVFREAATLLCAARREMIAAVDNPSAHGTDTLRPSSE